MNDNTIEIISLLYDDGENRGFSSCCSEVRHDRNRGDAHGRIGYYLNGIYLDNENFHDEFMGYLTNVPIARSISVDSRFLSNPDVVAVLANAPDLREIRITDDGYTITEEVLNMFSDRVSFSCDEISADVSLMNRSRVCAQHGLFKKETNYIEDDLVSGYFITRELSDDELDTLVDIINNDDSADYSQISFRVYNPVLYKDLVTKLRDRGLREDVRLNFLGNPLYDRSEAYDGLNDISNNPISITYDTCSDMVAFYTEEPFSVSNSHHSELEGGGTTSFDSFYGMLSLLEEQETHIREHNYSPLEAAIYAYRFLQQNYAYDPDSNTTDAINALTNRQLDIVAGSPTMVCEGYATLYSALLRRCGIPMFRYGTDRHVRNIGRIVDPKYGVDQIGVFDPTWDGSHILVDGSFDENNRFEFFMFSPREAVLYDPYVTIPSTLVIDYEATGNPYLSMVSRDPFEHDLSLQYSADGYAATMLDRMGIQLPEPFTFEDYRGLISDLNNTNLFGYIDSNAFANAYSNVLRSENVNMSSHEVQSHVWVALTSMRDRLSESLGMMPLVTLDYDPENPIDAVLYPASNTLDIANFNKPVETVQNDIGEANDEVVIGQVHTEEPQILYGPRPVDEEVIVSDDDVNDAMDEAMDDISLDEFIPGTRIRKPRYRDPYETDEEYVAYLAEYYGRYFPQAQQETRENTTYHLTKDEIIQDLPIHSQEPSRYTGVMTDDEIEVSRNKLR